MHRGPAPGGPAAEPAPAAGVRHLGLRVDVDTHAGMRDGVPRLLDTLRRAGIRATFYFSMGPDRSGRAILNGLRPGFLTKMLRTGAPRVYGWRTMLSGTLLPARPVALAFPEVARRARDLGHETGVHAWDHRTWQDRLLRLGRERIAGELEQAFEAFRTVLGEAPRTFAAPAWLSNDDALLHQETFGLLFASDCRGTCPFIPELNGRILATPQVPATLPTLDEALGFSHRSAGDYFDSLPGAIAPGTWPVLTIHAEMEGGPYAREFGAFLERARALGIRCLPLGDLLRLRLARGPLPTCPLVHAAVPGRHGVVSLQAAGAGLLPGTCDLRRSPGMS